MFNCPFGILYRLYTANWTSTDNPPIWRGILIAALIWYIQDNLLNLLLGKSLIVVVACTKAYYHCILSLHFSVAIKMSIQPVHHSLNLYTCLFFRTILVFELSINLIWFSNHDYESTRWRCFQKRVVHIKVYFTYESFYYGFHDLLF
jgi:hypothetical protein